MANAESALKMAVCLLVMAELLLAKKDYYDILGVPKDATERQIKKAFHGLAMRYHPDRNNSPDAEVRFREIAEAYEMLSDVTRRGEYDQFGGSASYFTAGMQQRRSARQPFSFKLEDILEDFNMDNHNSRHARQRQHFDEHSQRESHGRHKRNFEGAGFLGDLFDDVEKIFAFHMHPTQTEGIFHTSSKQHCRTVTQRRENMVTTYTDCTAI